MINVTDKGIIELITNVEQCPSQYFWIRSSDFMQQLYISDKFTQIWGRSIEPLFDHATAFRDALLPDDETIIKRYHQRKKANSLSERQQPILSRIKTPSGDINHLRDTCFGLHDRYGNLVGMAGIGTVITANEWELEIDGKLLEEHPASKILHSLSEIHINGATPLIAADIKIAHKMHKQKYLINTQLGEIALTKREFECLQLLLGGKTSKETGKYLNISPRTVEDFLDKIRIKLHCRNKLEIANRLMPQPHLNDIK